MYTIEGGARHSLRKPWRRIASPSQRELGVQNIDGIPQNNPYPFQTNPRQSIAACYACMYKEGSCPDQLLDRNRVTVAMCPFFITSNAMFL